MAIVWFWSLRLQLHELGHFGMYNCATLVTCQSSVKYLTDFVNVTPNKLPRTYVIMAKLHLRFL